MLKNSTTCKFSLILAFLLIFTISCEEDIQPQNEEDPYMEEAIQLADDYIESTGQARRSVRIAITVLQYYEGKLYYATNTDNIRGYREVGEQTITAYVEPGEYMFWFTGAGVTELDGIEFDVVATYKLHNAPEEVNPAKLWLIQVPEDIETNDEDELKYDIIYQYKGNEGNDPIRLDPKLKVGNT